MTERARIASRGSELALWQARFVESALREGASALTTEIVVVRTTGDRITDVPLAQIGDRGLFTKEIDEALLSGAADLAVHSLKDVPTRLPAGLTIAAVSAREDPRDALLLPRGVRGSLASLARGSRIGTSSLRRRAQLRAVRPDLEVVDLRGNLNTRVAKLDRGEYDAVILAAAGVVRLGWRERITEYLDPAGWLPAVGQGALAVVTRAEDDRLIENLQAFHHPATAGCVTAERAFLHALQGGCQIPIGALGVPDGDLVHLRGMVADLEGTRILRGERSLPASDAERAGAELAEQLRTAGADRILDEIRGSPAAPVPAP